MGYLITEEQEYTFIYCSFHLLYIHYHFFFCFVCPIPIKFFVSSDLKIFST